MEGLPNIVEATRKMTEAYANALSIMTKSLENIPKQSSEAHRSLEQWLRLARMSKDGFVIALEQGFELWESALRRALDASPTAASAAPARNPFEVWVEHWKKGLEAFTGAGKPGDVWSEQARRQAELIQQTMQEGLQAWQRLWQPPERKA